MCCLGEVYTVPLITSFLCFSSFQEPGTGAEGEEIVFGGGERRGRGRERDRQDETARGSGDKKRYREMRIQCCLYWRGGRGRVSGNIWGPQNPSSSVWWGFQKLSSQQNPAVGRGKREEERKGWSAAQPTSIRVNAWTNQPSSHWLSMVFGILACRLLILDPQMATKWAWLLASCGDIYACMAELRKILTPQMPLSFKTANPTDVAFKIGSQIMREKVTIGKTL